ncbi:hypothetical protein F901_02344 [Acinetobacter dispersus]|uniref:hypothetical protein n=1 Tax=Acinetobacter dispersus TaxID=70348 RepID=UPI0002D0E7DE|nr:hypothetical protein [Acinetobacter dispersus]ENX52615.1 hypothetical protein F901_02344 [Acinetobacter dispersus]
MKYQNLVCGGVITIMMVGCSTIPTKPILSGDQSLTQDGFIKSHKGDFVVRVKKVDTSSEDYRSIAKYGLPLHIIVANFSNASIDFSPNNILLYKNGHVAKPLTSYRLDEIKSSQQTRNTAWGIVNGALAMAVGVAGAVSGDNSLAQSTQQYATDSLNLTMQSHAATKQNTEEKMDALGQQVDDSLLQSTVLKPKGVATGIVYFENIKTDDPVEIVIQTGLVNHKIVYQK